MPKITNPVIISKIIQGILEGKPDSIVLADAGLAKSTAKTQVKRTKILKVVKSRIAEEFKAEEITVEEVLRRIDEDRMLAQRKGDYSTALQADIALGRYLAMFTDKVKADLSVINSIKSIVEVANQSFNRIEKFKK